MKQKYWTITDSKDVTTSDIVKEARSLFNVYMFSGYEEDLDTQFPAPENTIEVLFKANIEPDEKHLGKSYDDAIKEGIKFADIRQYLLLCIHVFKTEEKQLDVKGWTRTSSLWSGGGLVRGYWRPDSRGVCLDCGRRDRRDADGGVREKFNLKTVSSSTSKKVDSLELAIQEVKKAGYVIYQKI